MGQNRLHKLSRSFYDRPTLEVLADIIGKVIVYNSPRGELSARITEAEAYIGESDPACHAAVGKTERNGVMFGPAGYSYIYFIYGMYHCLNFVTEQKDHPAAILLRAARPISGVEIMRRNSPGKKDVELLNGPGKFCRSFGLTRRQNGLDLAGNELYLGDDGFKSPKLVKTTRIGIQKARDLPWRYYEAGSDYISCK